MCGIAGYFTTNSTSKEKLNQIGSKMLTAIENRGPDAQNIEIFANEHNLNGVFAHSRLAIIDLSENANQPMSYNEFTIVYNGEIYNYQQLQQQLKTKGYSFNSNSDTEVILKGFAEWGPKVLNMLEGMFAFAIYNNVSGKLTLARDHFGIKPLYYSSQANHFAFGSNLKAIKQSGHVSFQLNEIGLQQNFAFISSLYPFTCFDSILIVKPGHYIEVENYTVKEHQYYSIEMTSSTSFDYNEATEQYEALLQKALKSTSLSDVPIGILLSGGIDSTVIAKLSNATQKSLFSITLGDEFALNDKTSDAYFAQQLAEEEGFNHHFCSLSESDIVEQFWEILSIFEEPISAIEPHFFIGKQLQQMGQKVIFSGLGPDELLLGYSYQFKLKKYYNHQLLQQLQSFIPPLNGKFKKLKKVVQAKSLPQAYKALQGDINQHYFNDLFKQANKNKDLTECLDLAKTNDFSKQLTDFELKQLISNHHMLSCDKYLMHFGVEGRFPYLMKDVVEFTYHAPNHLKLVGNGKQLQRNLASKYLSQQFLNRPKTGFITPTQRLLNNTQFNKMFKHSLLELEKKDIIYPELLHSLTNKGIKQDNIQLAIYLMSLNNWIDNWL